MNSTNAKLIPQISKDIFNADFILKIEIDDKFFGIEFGEVIRQLRSVFR